MGKAIKPQTGCTIRLIRDFVTRGGRTFRRGLTMRIDYSDREWNCGVWVRNKHHSIRVQKKYAHLYFEVIAPPPKPEKDE